MLSKSDNLEIMISDKADEVIEELFKSLLNTYQSNLEKLIRGSEFVFDYLYLLYYKCHKTNPNCDESYEDSPNWVKNEQQLILSIKIINAFNTL